MRGRVALVCPGRERAGITTTNKSLTEASAANDEETLMTTFLIRGATALSVGDLDTVEQDFVQALATFRERNDSWSAACEIICLA